METESYEMETITEEETEGGASSGGGTEEEAAVVATKPVAKPSIGLSDIGRLAKSAIFWQRARARDAEVERPEAHRHQVRKGGEASSISQERGGLKTELAMAPWPERKLPAGFR